MKKKLLNEPSCPVDYAFKRIGGKYKGRILWYLHMNPVMRYGELRKTLSDITPKMLTQTVRELEDDGLVHRKIYHEVPPKVEYSLTDIGAELIPFIDHLRQWGEHQIEKERAKI
ncbi:MAG: helix-turn-helix transcriptional regulator [Chryseobacterium sp.]|uniref:winged helix-turn-helix transcriptional regulator n=1 Tax=Chryseobacterium sp. TaxID=1871047 RepID=UPI0025BEA6F9|nr:helix-turn-helix domain-containing protein [Chryseobacterium sp.]MCJ7934100.1 helix-turn-helix transcriptional regulator [Chryseobacterium sp.]